MEIILGCRVSELQTNESFENPESKLKVLCLLTLKKHFYNVRKREMQQVLER